MPCLYKDYYSRDGESLYFAFLESKEKIRKLLTEKKGDLNTTMIHPGGLRRWDESLSCQLT